jgi:hypothetical protein
MTVTVLTGLTSVPILMIESSMGKVTGIAVEKLRTVELAAAFKPWMYLHAAAQVRLFPSKTVLMMLASMPTIQ